MNCISQKIVVSMILCTFLAILAAGGFSVFYIKNQITESTYSYLTENSKVKGQEMNTVIRSVESNVDALNRSIIGVLDKNRISDKEYFVQYTAEIEKIAAEFDKNAIGAMSVYARFDPALTYGTSGFFHADTNGDGVLEQLTPTDLSQFDPSDAEHVGWFYEPLKAGKPIWMNPYHNANINVDMLSYIAPVVVDGKAIGIVGVDINFDQLKQIVQTGTETGKAFLLNSDYNFLVHDVYKMEDALNTIENGQLSFVVDTMKKMPDGTENYALGGTKKILGFSKLSNGWTVGIALTEKEAFAELNRTVMILVVLNLIVVAITIAIAIYLGSRISRPIVRMIQLVERFSTLDFTETEDYSDLTRNTDETGQIAKGILELRSSLRNIVSSIHNTSSNINQETQSVSASADTTAESMKTVEETIVEMAKGSSEQADETARSAERLNLLAEEITIVSDSAETVREYSSIARDANEKGRAAVNTLSDRLKENTAIMEKVQSNTTVLSNKSGTIGEIVNTIQLIADQTNLLALNAAIEAARAGESGRGFSVVAEEIRKLAEQTSESSRKISDIIQEIQTEIVTTKTNMDEAISIVKHQESAMGDAGHSLASIDDSIRNTIQKIDTLVANIGKLNKDKEEVLHSIQGISAIAEETAAATLNSSDIIRAETRSIQKIQEACTHLNRISEQLESLIVKFKL